MLFPCRHCIASRERGPPRSKNESDPNKTFRIMRVSHASADLADLFACPEPERCSSRLLDCAVHRTAVSPLCFFLALLRIRAASCVYFYFCVLFCFNPATRCVLRFSTVSRRKVRVRAAPLKSALPAAKLASAKPVWRSVLFLSRNRRRSLRMRGRETYI